MAKSNQYFITGIGTEVGKTVVSAIVAEALQSSYWKPIQAGDLDNSDSHKIAAYTKNVTVLKEQFRLTQPMSPHAAADIDGVEIRPNQIKIPSVEGNLLIEGAGGLMVPFNNHGQTWLDWLKIVQLPVIVVSRHYLGSINHTLMTLELLKQSNIQVDLLVFVGDKNSATEEIILNQYQGQYWFRVPMVETIDKDFVSQQADLLRSTAWF